MRNSFRGTIRLILLLVVSGLSLVLAAPALADSAGAVHFERSADSSFDAYSSSTSAATRASVQAHVWRMIVWSPFFDDKTSWYQHGWVYDDAYAIYTDSQLANDHPEWILRDGAGNKLYIPFACSGGTCSQYAGDISSAAFRQYWIAKAQARMAHGYQGIYIDDVNMEQRVSDGQGNHVAPIDSATGQPMSDAAWRAYMAEFMAEIRAALPQAEITHNAIWFSDSNAGTSDPAILREIRSADYIGLERGVTDSGLTGGSGPWSLASFLSFVDQVHAQGKGVLLESAASDVPSMTYNLAAYFLISGGGDVVSSEGQVPGNWWSGFDVNLADASGPRYPWNGLMRRDFTGGLVLVNEPGAPTRTVILPRPMKDLNGQPVTSVTLSAASGAVLRNLTAVATPVGTAPSPTPAPTQTTVIVTAATVSPAGGPSPGSAASAPTAAVSQPAAAAPPVAQPRHRSGSGSRHRRARSRAVVARVGGSVRRATRGWVVIQIQTRIRGRWVQVRRAQLAIDAAGDFMRVLHLPAGRYYRVRAMYQGAPGFRASRSHFRLVVPRRAG